MFSVLRSALRSPPPQGVRYQKILDKFVLIFNSVVR